MTSLWVKGRKNKGMSIDPDVGAFEEVVTDILGASYYMSMLYNKLNCFN